eukprot:CAMPEP_0197702862 /NCGR_PEP_ID=MMETSP1338-20131121/125056_1 /TAXON_ID=43686 ORGANISM="Pelagodinium beii, Strain RCC1491" /NCGR_SAMPLE_ID=MMETSP1338 /ASSEMBLY_ACC=CAM_ASM_000754 /LENGTH=447 /DNA_ID=CAMNT_0043286745 /DNA_START=59 /DNA_END=1399 /DNA_ORIENTATION=+
MGAVWSSLQEAPSGNSKTLIGFITDCEGNFDYWQKCVELSRVVGFNDAGELQFSRPHEADRFVFGGDVFDKGPGDIRIAVELVRFKRRHPERVWLLAGNRDLNKLRFTAELAEEDVDVGQPVPLYPRAPPQVSLRSFLEKRAAEEGAKDLSAVNTKANRLRWILEHTMTAGGAFEHRRKELALLEGQAEDSVTDDAVVQSFVDSVAKEDGFVWSYLFECSFAVVLDGTLFVHGGIPKDAPGWLPPPDMRYLSPKEGASCGGTNLPEGHNLGDWVAAMNDFLKEGLKNFREQTSWRSDRSRGGEALLSMTSSPASFQRSIVVESLLQGGMPVDPDPNVEAYLARGGIVRVICGHKPCGDSPFVIRRQQVEYVHCDTTYSDSTARDKRGNCVAAVEVECAGQASSQLCIRGILCDGRSYDFTLPGSEQLAGGSEFVGRQLQDGWWVKAK